MREFDAATIMWRTEQGDLAKDFRQPALRACSTLALRAYVAHEEEPRHRGPVDEVIHPWLIRLCSVFLDQGMAYWPMPQREQGFYESVRTLLAQPRRNLPQVSDGLGRRISSASSAFPFQQRTRSWITWTLSISMRPNGEDVLQAELLALPGWAGLMRRLEEDPALAPHRTLPVFADGLPGRAADHVPRGLAHGRSGGGPRGEPAQDSGETASEPGGPYL